MTRHELSVARREAVIAGFLRHNPEEQNALLVLLDAFHAVGDVEGAGSAWLGELAVTTPWLVDWASERVSRMTKTAAP